MKKLFSSRFFFALIGILGIVVGLNVSRVAFAEAAESSVNNNQISQLAATLEKIFIRQQNTELMPINRTYGETSGVKNPSCIDNYESWPHSNVYNPSTPWNMDFMARKRNGSAFADNMHEQFVEINGDGLNDYLYAYRYKYNGYGNKKSQDYICLYLNTGSGFEPAYRCVAQVVYTTNYQADERQDYYGDCAQL